MIVCITSIIELLCKVKSQYHWADTCDDLGIIYCSYPGIINISGCKKNDT